MNNTFLIERKQMPTFFIFAITLFIVTFVVNLAKFVIIN